jgi:hypothetical protein|tara:strand:+ start:94 stop:1080 length:987 start_codon:yes stop_codon:yes gene_type:complete
MCIIRSSSASEAESDLLSRWEPLGPLLLRDTDLQLAPEGWGPVFPLSTTGGGFDLLVSARDASLRQHIVRCHTRLGAPPLGDHDVELALALGDPGGFDADGVGAPWVATLDGKRILLYVGRKNLAGPVPFQTQLGIASLSQEGFVVARSKTPLLPLTKNEPIGNASCCVFPSPSGPQLIYTSFLRWEDEGEQSRHYYTLRKVKWADRELPSPREVVIPLGVGEYAVTAPSLLDLGDTQLLTFTARGPSYQIFLAASSATGVFHRLNGAIQLPRTDLDSEMQCYPRFVEWNSEVLLLYSGNRFGRDALLAARWNGEDLAKTIKGFLENF